MTGPEPLSRENATGNGVASSDDLIRVSATLIGAVNGLRDEMVRRFGDVKAQLDGVCADVTEIKQDRAIEAAVADAAKEGNIERRAIQAEGTLSFRWRVTIAVAAASAIFGALLGVANFLAGH